MNILIDFIKKNYRSIIACIYCIIMSVIISSVWVFSDFYYAIESDLIKAHQLMKNEKYKSHNIFYQDIIKYHTYCHKKTFKIYMDFQSLDEQIKINKVCSKIENIYQKI